MLLLLYRVYTTPANTHFLCMITGGYRPHLSKKLRQKNSAAVQVVYLVAKEVKGIDGLALLALIR